VQEHIERRFVEDELRYWKAPGVAVALVRDGETMFSAGYGMRDLEGSKPVTADTALHRRNEPSCPDHNAEILYNRGRPALVWL
jgi:hypothetical protein